MLTQVENVLTKLMASLQRGLLLFASFVNIRVDTCNTINYGPNESVGEMDGSQM